jgi:hypothetical protein
MFILVVVGTQWWTACAACRFDCTFSSFFHLPPSLLYYCCAIGTIRLPSGAQQWDDLSCIPASPHQGSQRRRALSAFLVPLFSLQFTRSLTRTCTARGPTALARTRAVLRTPPLHRGLPAAGMQRTEPSTQFAALVCLVCTSRPIKVKECGCWAAKECSGRGVTPCIARPPSLHFCTPRAPPSLASRHLLLLLLH